MGDNDPSLFERAAFSVPAGESEVSLRRGESAAVDGAVFSGPLGYSGLPEYRKLESG